MTRDSSEKNRWLYGFKTSRIQRYIMGSSRLRDIQGASYLVEELCMAKFAEAIKCLGEGVKVLSQAAGGARVASDRPEALEQLYRLWPMLADHHAPGVSIQQAIVQIDGTEREAHEKLDRILRGARNLPAPRLPEVPPIVLRTPRTGEPAVRHGRTRRDRTEPLDRITEKKQRAAQRLRRSASLDNRLLGDLSRDYSFAGPADDDAPSGLAIDPHGYIAVIHADGNRFGSALQSAQINGRSFADFSKELKKAIDGAAQAAVHSVLVPASRPPQDGSESVVPARPILFGGDDITIITAASLAVPFVKKFSEEFESRSKDFGPGGSALTFASGIAFVKEKFPYDRAHLLAESLCQRAKTASRGGGGTAPCSSVAFYRVTTSLPGDAGQLDDELTIRDFRLFRPAYAIGSGPRNGMTSLDTLERLSAATATVGRGALRSLVTALHERPEGAKAHLDRVLQVLRDRGDSRAKSDFAAAIECLPEDDFLHSRAESPRCTSLLDALVLAFAGGAAGTVGARETHDSRSEEA